MKSISIGKFLNLQRCITRNGGFSILALDHRNNLRKSLDPQNPQDVTYEQMIEFKLNVTRRLSASASAILLDPEVGVFQAASNRALSRKTGIIVALEATGYTGNAIARESRVLPGWSVEKAKYLGVNAVKLLVYYHPNSSKAGQVEELVAFVEDECNRFDLPFILESLIYSPEIGGKRISGNERKEVILETAQRLTRIGCDLLKAEFPLDVQEYPDESIWADACSELTKASQAPWVLLSAGVDYDTYVKQVIIACQNGAAGIAVGRAVWSEASTLKNDQRDDFLEQVACARMQRLTSLVDGLAFPFQDLYTTPATNNKSYLVYGKDK